MWFSTNLFRLESSILTRAKRATNRNNVATEKRSYIFNFFSEGFWWRGFCRGDFILEPKQICPTCIAIAELKVFGDIFMSSVFFFFFFARNKCRFEMQTFSWEKYINFCTQFFSIFFSVKFKYRI